MSHGHWCSRMATHFLIGALGLTVLVASIWPTDARAQVVPISGLSVNPDGGDPNDPIAVTACNGAPSSASFIAIARPSRTSQSTQSNTANMIAGWHQDRWSTGGAQSLGAAYTTDGGASWQQVVIPFTRCSGAALRSAGDYERASDPWISFSPNGTAHYMALVTDTSVNENAMVASRSTDGGATWSPPIVIARNPAQDSVARSPFHDKNTITADPHDSQFVYATWTLFRTGITSLLFARSTDGGLTWSHPVPIATMGSVETIAKRYVSPRRANRRAAQRDVGERLLPHFVRLGHRGKDNRAGDPALNRSGQTLDAGGYARRAVRRRERR